MRRVLNAAARAWQELISRLLPENHARLPDAERRRGRTLAQVVAACIGLSILLVPYYALVGLWPVVWAQVAAAAWYAVCLVALRSERLSGAAPHLFVLATFLLTYGFSLLCQPNPDISPEWLLPAPVLALALCGPRGGTAWLGFGVSAVAIRFTLEAHGIAPVSLFPSLPSDLATRFASIANAMVILFVLNSLYEYDQRLSIAALERSHARLRRLTDILEASSDFVFVTEANHRLLYANAMAHSEFGLHKEAVFLDLVAPSLPLPIPGREVPGAARSDLWRGELELVARKGVIPVSVMRIVHRSADGAVERFSIVARDISEQKAAERQLAHRATHDWLTDLPGRALFLDRVSTALRRLDRFPGMVAVLFVDLDDFKAVNDRLGHDAGDQLLLGVADRLRAATRGTDAIARFGGDEFVALCEVGAAAGALIVADRFQRSLARPVRLGSEEVMIGASIGIALASSSKEDPGRLIARADSAMYSAKSSAKGSCAIFQEDASRSGPESEQAPGSPRALAPEDDPGRDGT